MLIYVNMPYTDYEMLAEYRLGEQGFHCRKLDKFDLPQPVTFGDGLRYSANWNDLDRMADSSHLAISPLPYSTTLDDKSIQLRLATQQMALGDDYAVVGLEVYNPRVQPLTKNEREEVAAGSFKPFAQKVLSFVDALARDDQKVSLYGFSMGADVSVEAAHINMFSAHGGIRPIDYLGAFECAGMQNRGRLALQRVISTSLAFRESGPDLWRNVVASRSPALLEAREISGISPADEKLHDKRVAKGVKNYISVDKRGSWALASGFGNAMSRYRLSDITASPGTMPKTTVGRMQRSTLMPEDFRDLLGESTKLVTAEYDEDHSAADRLTMSAAFILQTQRITA